MTKKMSDKDIFFFLMNNDCWLYHDKRYDEYVVRKCIDNSEVTTLSTWDSIEEAIHSAQIALVAEEIELNKCKCSSNDIISLWQLTGKKIKYTIHCRNCQRKVTSNDLVEVKLKWNS